VKRTDKKFIDNAASLLEAPRSSVAMTKDRA